MAVEQASLFAAPSAVPDGFRYQPELITVAQEVDLLGRVRALPFANFEFHGFVGKRRVVSFGWRYDFNERAVRQADDIPDFLLALRQTAAQFAGLDATALQQALVTEYASGSSIGWHSDKAVFGDVIGVSLLSACTFRLRRKSGAKWERYTMIADPRSAYLLRGVSRTEWEHSIPAVPALRYSITFRNFRTAA